MFVGNCHYWQGWSDADGNDENTQIGWAGTVFDWNAEFAWNCWEKE